MSLKKKILLVCSSGMSTSLLVKAMQKSALEEGFAADISSAPVAGVEETLKGCDAVLVGPQIRHRFEQLKIIADKTGVPIKLIPAQIYGLVDGKAALALVKKNDGGVNNGKSFCCNGLPLDSGI